MPTPKKKKGLAAANKPQDIKKSVSAEELKPAPDVEMTPGTGGKLEDVKTGIPKDTEEKKDKVVQDAIDELNEEINANWRLAYDAAREWIDEAKEDIKFKAGEQWSEEDKQTLSQQGRPCMTFNKIKPIVKLLTGHFLQNSARIQISPEGGEDQKFSAVADKVMSFIDEHSSLEFNLGYQFSGGQTTGRAFLELYLDYEADPIFGHLKSIYHAKPGTIFPDPRGVSYDLNEDREFVFKLVKRTKSWMKQQYPDKIKEIDEIVADTENPMVERPGVEGGPNNYGLDKNRSKLGINTGKQDPLEKQELRQYHIKEYWRNKYLTKWFVYFVDKGDMPRFDSKELAEAEIEKRKAAYLAEGGVEALWKPLIRDRKVKQTWVALRCGGVVLTDGKSPVEKYVTGFPFFQYIADWTPEAEKDRDSMQGIVRCLKDPQREKNKARSQFLHIINTAANSGWIGDEDSLTDTQKVELKKFGSQPGITIWKKTGSQLNKIEPTTPPMAQQVREKAANDDFKEVSGVNADLLAIDSSANPSGKAIALRIRQAITILETDFRNFRYTKKLVGTYIMKIVPTLFDVAKLQKVLGSQFMQTNGIDDIYLKAFLIQVEDLKYNVRIAEQGDTKTLREETFEDLMNMLQNGVGLPFDVIAEFMNIPNKEDVIGRVKAHQEAQAANAQAAELAKKGGQKQPALPGA